MDRENHSTPYILTYFELLLAFLYTGIINSAVIRSLMNSLENASLLWVMASHSGKHSDAPERFCRESSLTSAGSGEQLQAGRRASLVQAETRLVYQFPHSSLLLRFAVPTLTDNHRERLLCTSVQYSNSPFRYTDITRLR